MMEMEEVYRQLEGNYDIMVKRLRKDETIARFLQLFLQDEEFSNLERAMGNGDDKAAFEAAHALKGVSLNMEFGFLSKSLIQLVEALRYGRQENAQELYEQVKKDYAKTIEIIKGVNN